MFINLQELFLARKWLKVSETKGCGGNGEIDMEKMEKDHFYETVEREKYIH